MRRILVTGCRGQLGATLAALPTGGEQTIVGVDRQACDVTSAESVDRCLAALRPDAVINCAAWTRVDEAETNPQGAWTVNAIGPAILAAACTRRGTRLLHVSTDYVMAGDRTTPIPEDEEPSPQGEYGRSKLAGESAVREAGGDHLVVRTSWLYGRDGPNFVLTMLRLAASGTAPRVVADQTGSPTWTGHLAPALLRLAEIAAAGTYHLSNSGSTTWHGFADAIFTAAGLRVRAQAITTAEYPTPARRPAYSVLDNAAWRRLGEKPLPAWEEGVAAYVTELRQRAVLPGGTEG
ncbi:MAG: dTDP-4-dehydrorhamnose reductase [Candidatus Dormibacteria bacterium]